MAVGAGGGGQRPDHEVGPGGQLEARSCRRGQGTAAAGSPGAARPSCPPSRRRRSRRVPGGRRQPDPAGSGSAGSSRRKCTTRLRTGAATGTEYRRETRIGDPAGERTVLERGCERSGRQFFGGPCGGGRREWRDPRECASAAGTRGSSPGAGCWAETSACSRLYLQVRAWDRRVHADGPKHFRAAQKGPVRPGASIEGSGCGCALAPGSRHPRRPPRQGAPRNCRPERRSPVRAAVRSPAEVSVRVSLRYSAAVGGPSPQSRGARAPR